MKRKNNIDGISIKDFVNYYLGAEHECSKLKHQGLKSFNNPYVVGVSNDYAFKYPDCVVRQELLMVIDDYGHLGTYINPNNIKKLIELETCKEKMKILEGISCHNFDEVALLYQIWMDLTKDIKYLQGLYRGTYDLLYILNKGKLLRNIRKYAKEEAKRTLIFTSIKSVTDKDDTIFNYEDYQNKTDDEEMELLTSYSSDEYQVTERVNRLRTLNYKVR